jgi:signal peptidase II
MRRLLWLFLPLGVLGLDWFSKVWILANFQRGELKTLIPGFFNLTLGMNPGAIFGSFSGTPSSIRTALFTLATLVAVIYFGVEFLRERTPTVQRVALGLILGGAIGNAVDRLVHGAVVDVLDFVFWGWHYWTFNLADSGIVCGVILFAISLIWGHKARGVQQTS